ncbi:caspase family protein [Roseibium sp.]|uniref:caspase family protein n=1 Tax=Roseibium sp. TaxID=1936156 RepID=UPI003B52C991
MAKKTIKQKSIKVPVKGQKIAIPKSLMLEDGDTVIITIEDDGDDPRDTDDGMPYGEEIDTLLEKRLVSVGINDYRDNRISDLTGCVPDATNFSRKLNSDFGFSFDRDHFRFLTDDAATKANIISQLSWLVAETGPHDVGVFYYSGHGSQVPDQNPPNDDEPDRLDEVIVPHDTNTRASNPISTVIRDDEIAAILANINPEAHFVVVFDSCNSGTGTRQVPLQPDDGRARVAEVSKHATNLKGLFANAANSGLRGAHAFSGPNHLLLAAAHSSQLSWEFGGQGAFTSSLNQNMRPGRTYKEVMDAVAPAVDRRVMRAKSVHQTPQLEGSPQNNPLFAIVI